jgi:hypothetical protein
MGWSRLAEFCGLSDCKCTDFVGLIQRGALQAAGLLRVSVGESAKGRARGLGYTITKKSLLMLVLSFRVYPLRY